MAKIWRNRIIAGTKTYTEVPIAWKTEVKVLLKADVENEVITAEKYTELVGEEYTV